MTEEKKKEKRFDKTFAEIVERYPQELIPVINEVFHTNYAETELVKLYRDAQHEKDGLIITDSYVGIADSLYHIECQSVKDDEMAIRMIRYDFAMAWKNAVKTEIGYEMRFPESCVLYLRSTRNTPDKLMIKLLLPGGREAVYETPVVKIKTYSKEEIFQKRLLLFIPFYILRYESAIKRNRNKALEKMYGELKEILVMLEKAKKTTEKNGIYSLIEESFQKINNYISETNQKCKERIGEIMRGNTLELETIRNWDEGHAIGIQEGHQKGISEGIPLGEARQLVRSVDNMVEKHNLSCEEACDYVGVTSQQYNAAKELVGGEKTHLE